MSWVWRIHCWRIVYEFRCSSAKTNCEFIFRLSIDAKMYLGVNENVISYSALLFSIPFRIGLNSGHSTSIDSNLRKTAVILTIAHECNTEMKSFNLNESRRRRRIRPMVPTIPFPTSSSLLITHGPVGEFFHISISPSSQQNGKKIAGKISVWPALSLMICAPVRKLIRR